MNSQTQHSDAADRAPIEPAAVERQLTGAQAVAQVIAAQNAPTVYGMPGGYTMHIYDALHSLQDRVDTHLVRQESIATVMAEAQGRLTGTPAFVIAQGAWVLGNAGIGIMEAHLGASPLVALIDGTEGGSFSHHGPYQSGLGGYGAYDLPAAMAAITKRVFVAHDATQALQMTQLAIKHATTGEPGPVAVIFSHSAITGRINPATQPPTHLDRSYAGPEAPVATDASIARAAELIRVSSRPVIISGNGVRLAKAEQALVGFARSIGAPVATSPAGKGTFAESEPLAVGVMGAFGHEVANEIVAGADLLIAVGTKLGSTDTANEHRDLIDVDRQKLVHIDIEPLNLSWTTPADAMILGDAGDSLARLQATLDGFTRDGEQRVARSRKTHGYFDRPITSTPGALSARDVVAALSAGLADDAVVTCDAGENRLFVLRDFQTKPGGTVLQPNGGGGMGYSIPAAMAAAVNFEGRPAVAVLGDGGFGMSLQSVLSAVELDLKVTIVVLDNNILGWVYNGQRGRTIASEFKQFDYAGIASAMGAHADHVTDLDGFRAALSSAQDRSGVSVIVAQVSKADRYQDIMASLNTNDVYSVPEN